MTKRDVAVWFCKVVALAGIGHAVFGLLSQLVSWRFHNGSIPWWAVLALGFYCFVYLFAQGIGTELAAEGEYGESMKSSADLGGLLLRCAGLGLFLSGVMIFGSTFIHAAIQHFSAVTIPNYYRYLSPSLVSGFVQSAIGFVLAFGPRLRAAMRSN